MIKCSTVPGLRLYPQMQYTLNSQGVKKRVHGQLQEIENLMQISSLEDTAFEDLALE